jgi:hypothetical protein
MIVKGKEIIDFGLDDFDDIRPTEQGFLVTLQHHIFEVPFLAKFNLLNVFLVTITATAKYHSNVVCWVMLL